MAIKHDLSLLAKLLNRTPEEIQSEALSCYVKHVLDPQRRGVYNNFIEAVALTARKEDHTVAQRYRVSPKCAAIKFLPNKTKGRIMSSLKERAEFTRDEFRQVVAETMAWRPATAAFGITTKFRGLDDADRAWWGTLKSNDRLIEEVR